MNPAGQFASRTDASRLPLPETGEPPTIEALFVREGAVTEAQVERARRIAARLPKPRPIGEILAEMGQLARAEYDRIHRLHRSMLSLAQILAEDGVLGEQDLAAYAHSRQLAPEATERQLLVDGGLVNEENYLKALAARHDVPYVEPDVGLVDLALIGKTSLPYLRRHVVLPLRIGDGVLTAVLCDPLDVQAMNELGRIFDVPVRPCCATEDRILKVLDDIERLRDSDTASNETRLQFREIDEAAGLEVTGEGAVAILDYLMLRSIQLRASDLHIEPQEKRLRVRVRVDGVLQSLTDLPLDYAPQLISRIKVVAGADIAERRLHQDGRMHVRGEGRDVDVRVSTYVSMFGEAIVMRLLDRTRGLMPLDQLGFEPKVLGMLREIVLPSSSGLLLVTGPTGSGKTSTLYSFVDFVNEPSVKTISCEDPVEYVLEGVTQCSVNEKSGPTFADSLRAIVRQDPENIVVGEIRDTQTAGLAVEAALTGHKVFSTFHTEDAVGAMVRLLDMGIEPFLVASTIGCIVAQRLVRRVCDGCRAPVEASRDDLRFLGLERSGVAGLELMRGAGCAACGGTGYRGRVGIHEVLVPDDDFRDAVLRRAAARELRGLARKIPAFLTLQESGVLKAGEGLTTLAEVVANAPRDTAPRSPLELRELLGEGRA